MYQRPPYPETWARKHEKGRVFFTSLGHREDVWESDFFQNLLLGGLAWALGNVEADVTPNIDKVTPNANELPDEEVTLANSARAAGVSRLEVEASRHGAHAGAVTPAGSRRPLPQGERIHEATTIGRRGPVRGGRAGPVRDARAGRRTTRKRTTMTGWVQLFNGKNLNGWVVHPEDKARWSVQDGSIVGEGPVGHLYTERGDYENFRLPHRGDDQRRRQQRPVLPHRDRQGLPPGALRGPDQRHARRPAANRQPVQHRQGLRAEAQAGRVVHAGSHRRRRPHHHHPQWRDGRGHARLEVQQGPSGHPAAQRGQRRPRPQGGDQGAAAEQARKDK